MACRTCHRILQQRHPRTPPLNTRWWMMVSSFRRCLVACDEYLLACFQRHETNWHIHTSKNTPNTLIIPPMVNVLHHPSRQAWHKDACIRTRPTSYDDIYKPTRVTLQGSQTRLLTRHTHSIHSYYCIQAPLHDTTDFQRMYGTARIYKADERILYTVGIDSLTLHQHSHSLIHTTPASHKHKQAFFHSLHHKSFEK